MPFKPSRYQTGVFDWIKDGRGDAIVNAVAGSGKTTTLVEAAHTLKSKNSIFIAFNKHIADELQKKLAGTGMMAKTIHSVGNGMLMKHLGKTNLEDKKYKKLAKSYIDQQFLDWDAGFEAVSMMVQLASLARVNLTDVHDTSALASLCLHYNIDVQYDCVLEGLPGLLRDGKKLAEQAKQIDFTDMIWLPVVWNLEPPKCDWVFVDECQDLNAAQLAIALKCRAEGGRMLFVGDRQQAIYGFAGADAYSFDRIKEKTSATVLPLSICYRCPKTHVEMAQRIVPQIEPREDAPDGKILYENEDNLRKLVKEGDLVLCRLTAPLVAECIGLIKEQVAARVRGRDIGRDLAAVLRAVAKIRDFRYSEITAFLTKYEDMQVQYLIQKDADETQIESLRDRVECLRVCAAAYSDATSIEALSARIETLFSDDRPSVWLSTVHRAKGLENERVFILRPDKLPLVWKDQQPWQLEQEMNLKYVALTRAKDTLIILGPEPGKIVPEVETPELPVTPVTLGALIPFVAAADAISNLTPADTWELWADSNRHDPYCEDPAYPSKPAANAAEKAEAIVQALMFDIKPVEPADPLKVVREMFELLHQHQPDWYTVSHQNRFLTALEALEQEKLALG